MNVPQIKQIDQLFQLGPNKIIKNQKIRLLTAPGENYGSLMLSVEVTVQTPNGEENIQAVAKLVPPNELLQTVFNSKVTFPNEIAFYKKTVPLLRNFQKENGIENVIDFTPEYFGSRLNLKGDSEEVGDDTALVLENLKIKGFVTLERTEGLDFATAKLIIKDLAHLHAVSLALKLQKREVFEKEIKPYLHGFRPDEKLQNWMKNDLVKIINQAGLASLNDRILASLDHMVAHGAEAREPFATLIHDDCWTNNTMIRYEGTIPKKSKILDFQLCSYGSPAKDILFFLFSSVKEEVVVDKYDQMLQIYHEDFLSVLTELKCDVKDFGFEEFLQEMDFEAKGQLGHLSFMLIPIFAPKKHVKDVSEVGVESMQAIAENITDLHKQKFVFIVDEFLKRNWL